MKYRVSKVLYLVVAASVVGALMTAYTIFRNRNADITLATESSDADVSILPNAVAATGYLEPLGEVIQLSAPAFQEGTRVEELRIKQGDRVEAGQIIAVLDSQEQLYAALVRAQQQVKVAEANLAQVEAGAKQGEIDAQAAAVDRLRVELATRQDAQGATISRLEAELEIARLDCQRFESLYQDGAIAATERDNECVRVTSLQEQVNEATATLAQIVSTLTEQVRENEATLDQISEVRSVDVQAAQAELDAAKAAVLQAEADLNRAYVKSPQAGQVLEIYTYPGELVGADGIADIGQTDQMYVTAEVYETDISRVVIGQRARIMGNGIIPELQGTVEAIGLQIGTRDVLNTDPVADTDARVVEVKIRLDEADSQQVANLTNLEVNVLIDTTETNAIIPNRVESE